MIEFIFVQGCDFVWVVKNVEDFCYCFFFLSDDCVGCKFVGIEEGGEVFLIGVRYGFIFCCLFWFLF